MNYANYIKYEFDKVLNSKESKRKILFLSYLNIILIVLNIIFSCFFIAFFVYLSKTTQLNLKDNLILQEQYRTINNILLICFIVFWITYISFTIWYLYLFNDVITTYKRVFDLYSKYYWIAFILNIIGLFICFIALIGLGFSIFLTKEIIHERKVLIEKINNKN